MKWADLNGALSEECQQLAIMFNQSVDQAKHGTGNVEVSDHLRVKNSSIIRISEHLVMPRQRTRNCEDSISNGCRNKETAIQSNVGISTAIWMP